MVPHMQGCRSCSRHPQEHFPALKLIPALFLFQVGGTAESTFQRLQAGGALQPGQAGGGNLLAVACHKALRLKLDIAQQHVDGIAMSCIDQPVAAVRGQFDIDGIGIAQQVVHVAENFLVGTDHEEPQQVMLPRV